MDYTRFNYEKFENYMVIDFTYNGGFIVRLRFNNDYGVSIAKHDYSYGNKDDKFEVAVIEFYSDDNTNWDLTYDTEITNDVIGWLSQKDVEDLIERVIAL